MTSLPKNIQGILYALTYCLVGAVADVAARLVIESDLPLIQIVFLRCFLPMIIFMPLIIKAKKRNELKTRNTRTYALMAFFLLLSIITFYKALELLSLPLVGALSFVSTLLAVFAGSFFLRSAGNFIVYLRYL